MKAIIKLLVFGILIYLCGMLQYNGYYKYLTYRKVKRTINHIKPAVDVLKKKQKDSSKFSITDFIIRW